MSQLCLKYLVLSSNLNSITGNWWPIIVWCNPINNNITSNNWRNRSWWCDRNCSTQTNNKSWVRWQTVTISRLNHKTVWTTCLQTYYCISVCDNCRLKNSVAGTDNLAENIIYNRRASISNSVSPCKCYRCRCIRRHYLNKLWRWIWIC